MTKGIVKKNLRTRFKSERLVIRKLRRSDADDIYRNVKSRDVIRWTCAIPYPYPKDEAARFIRSVQHKLHHGDMYAFAIVHRETKTFMGIVSLHHVNRDHRTAELGYWLGKRHWGHGYMSEAVALMLRFCFEELKLHRVYGCAFEANQASQRVMLKNGFVHEGAWRQAIYRFGEHHDLHHFGLLREEWQAGQTGTAQ